MEAYKPRLERPGQLGTDRTKTTNDQDIIGKGRTDLKGVKSRYAHAWMDLEMGYSDWLYWTMKGDLAGFWEGLRWDDLFLGTPDFSWSRMADLR